MVSSSSSLLNASCATRNKPSAFTDSMLISVSTNFSISEKATSTISLPCKINQQRKYKKPFKPGFFSKRTRSFSTWCLLLKIVHNSTMEGMFKALSCFLKLISKANSSSSDLIERLATSSSTCSFAVSFSSFDFSINFQKFFSYFSTYAMSILKMWCIIVI